jgi:DNA-binding MarR family transcriptional regulator
MFEEKLLRPQFKKSIMVDRKISPLCRLIYIFINDYILEHMYKRDFTYSNETIAKEFSISYTTVTRRINELIKANYIRKTTDSNNRHYINLICDEKKVEYITEAPSSLNLLKTDKYLSFKEVKSVCIEFAKQYSDMHFKAENIDFSSNKYNTYLDDIITLKLDNHNNYMLHYDKYDKFLFKDDSNRAWNGIYKNQKPILESIRTYLRNKNE